VANNEALQKAAKAKIDEFYTQLPDIEAEMRHYKDQFRGKVILCNCDDHYESNFFKYFALNFNFLGLKKLIATSYTGLAGGVPAIIAVRGQRVRQAES
jgi:hypothetical protein